MKKPLAILLLLFSFVSAQETIAVIEFEGIGISQNEAKALTNRFRDELVTTGKYTVVERGQMDEILQEQAFQQTGCTSDECAVEVGKLLSVRLIVIGSISKVGDVFSISSRIVNVESGEIINTANYNHRGKIGDILTSGIMSRVASEVSGRINVSDNNAVENAVVNKERFLTLQEIVAELSGDRKEEYLKSKLIVKDTSNPLVWQSFQGSLSISESEFYNLVGIPDKVSSRRKTLSLSGMFGLLVGAGLLYSGVTEEPEEIPVADYYSGYVYQSAQPPSKSAKSRIVVGSSIIVAGGYAILKSRKTNKKRLIPISKAKELASDYNRKLVLNR